MRGLKIGSFAVALGLYPAEVSENRALGEILLSHPNLRYRAFVGNWETVNEYVLSRAVEIDDFATAREIINNSNGIGAAIPLQIETQLLSGELVLLKFQRPWLILPHGFILLKHRALSPAAEVFMDMVTRFEKAACLKNRELVEKYLG